MHRSLKYLMQFTLPNLGVILAFAAIVIVGSMLTGVPNGADNLFSTYYGMFPFMYLLVVLIVGFSYTTSNLQLALSYGARRKDYFWALQVHIVLQVLFGWVLNQIMAAVPQLLHWNTPESVTNLISFLGVPFPIYLLFGITIILLGCAFGPLYVRSRIISAVVMSIVVGVGIFLTVNILLFSAHGLQSWGDLPAIMCAAALAVCVVCECFLYRMVTKATVR